MLLEDVVVCLTYGLNNDAPPWLVRNISKADASRKATSVDSEQLGLAERSLGWRVWMRLRARLGDPLEARVVLASRAYGFDLLEHLLADEINDACVLVLL